jgi:hypothetical protein
MAAIARAFSRVSRIDVDVETLKMLVIFCGVGLLVSLLFASYGLDLSAGFFWQKNPPAWTGGRTIMHCKNIDDWRRNQGDLPGRPEAVRRLVDLGLEAKWK